MAVWETEDESTGPVMISLPTPAETPYRTPSRTSRRSRRSATPPGKGGKSSSPPPVPSERGSKRSSRDVSNDDSISVLDPRRFTPTLHANLVSEILSLRRDQEEKLKSIEALEAMLHTSREETETMQTTLSSTAKENRSLKRQLALLEGGTSSALGELARERDEAVESAAETKKRLETTQKKLRSQDEDSERVHHQWAQEKAAWEEEKRKYERKIHIGESRLKVVLDEVAAYQAHMQNAENLHESEVEESAKEDAASIRTMSMTNSIRFSVMANGVKPPNGNSLADELNLDSEYDDETDYGGRESVLSTTRHQRNASRDSVMSRTHRRNQSNDSLMRPGSVARGRLAMHHSTLERLEDRIIREDDETTQIEPAPKPSYQDSGVQYSPPPSPKVKASKPSTPEPMVSARLERLQDADFSPRSDGEIEANQRRKRVPSYLTQPVTTTKPSVPTSPMVNGSSQTADEPLSPPRTPTTPSREILPMPVLKPVEMVTASTQTDEALPPLQPSSSSLLSLPQMTIPTISIYPPTSRPSTPREPRLPQQFKDFGCQVSILQSVEVRSVSVQTEEIRIDKRLDRLPAHLHPSAITSRPTSPAAPPADAGVTDEIGGAPGPGSIPPPRNPRRLATKRSLTDMPSSPPPPIPAPFMEETHDAYPGNNDDGPLSSQKAPMRRPHRISSLFAGFDGNSSDEGDEFMNADGSDTEYRTALSAPRHNQAGGRVSKRNSGGVVAESTAPGKQNSAKAAARPLSNEAIAPNGYADRETFSARPEESRRSTRSSILGSSNKAGVMRKAAMIQSGIASHQRARSPSLTDPNQPPFPIPTRASSRMPAITASAPSDGRASPTRGSDGWSRRGGRTHYRVNSIRKVRSAAAMPRTHRGRRHGSRSPPPMSPTYDVPESPGLPPLPGNEVGYMRSRDSYTRARTHHPRLSNTTANTAITGNTTNTANTADTADTGVRSNGSSNQATGVVDAIAQTMVGEWMFKYVRRRKSFGVADNKGGDDTSNDRHKRWVWLAPYERAILWSSKQPSSGTALMGKPGRKLTIQSVLDVKDDNPAPKGSGSLFNRSILILTPQRALKFTAVNAERHYIWLTSLSFLAHSQQAVPEILSQSQQQEQKQVPEDFDMPKPKARRPGIRDSIRLTKSKGTIVSGGRPGAISVASSYTDSAAPSVPSVPSVPQIPEYRAMPEPYSLPTHARDLSRDAAEPPFIPRFADRAAQVPLHGRKRSNTGGHVPPPLSFRGFSGPIGGNYHHAATNSTAGNSVMTAGSSDIYQGTTSGASSGQTWATGSVRTSEASSRPSGAVMNNFFDAIGTVRMEAFISPLAFTPFEETVEEHEEIRRVARRRSKEMRRRASRSRHRDSYQSRGTRATDEPNDDWFTRDDPFKGF